MSIHIEVTEEMLAKAIENAVQWHVQQALRGLLDCDDARDKARKIFWRVVWRTHNATAARLGREAAEKASGGGAQ